MTGESHEIWPAHIHPKIKKKWHEIIFGNIFTSMQMQTNHFEIVTFTIKKILLKTNKKNIAETMFFKRYYNIQSKLFVYRYLLCCV